MAVEPTDLEEKACGATNDSSNRDGRATCIKELIEEATAMTATSCERKK
jgi:hypothetical protein